MTAGPLDVSWWRRWAPSLAIFFGVQLIAAFCIVSAFYSSRLPIILAHTLAGPLNLLLRWDRLWQYGVFPRDPVIALVLLSVLLMPWAHAWRPRPWWLAVSLLGSALWAASGFLFTIDHL